MCAAYYSCALNSFVHVLMYTHYLLAAMLGKNMKARRKYLWWSRYLTQFQMFQFVTMMVQVRPSMGKVTPSRLTHVGTPTIFVR